MSELIGMVPPAPELKTENNIRASLDLMRPMVSAEQILKFQQFYRKVERIDNARNPAVKDVEDLAAEVMSVMVKCVGLTNDDMVKNPAVISGMAQMLLIMIDSQAFGEVIPLKKRDVLHEALKILVDCMVVTTVRHMQLMNKLQAEAAAATKN